MLITNEAEDNDSVLMYDSREDLMEHAPSYYADIETLDGARVMCVDIIEEYAVTVPEEPITLKKLDR
jgi:hypothetical protein